MVDTMKRPKRSWAREPEETVEERMEGVVDESSALDSSGKKRCQQICQHSSRTVTQRRLKGWKKKYYNIL
jgi:hypothetical protein